MDEAWAFECSVECPVAAEFAWQFWTDPDTWRLDADVDAVERNGPFAAGTSGATITRSSGRVEWRIVDVQEGAGAVIEVPVERAVARFQWTFEDLGGRTRITQRASLSGEGAADLANQMAAMFEPTMPAGMRKLCEAMAKSAK
jgi:Polyketide cyclase / dehydrase and lipid transport